ncbi:hypothetical protein PybrP1_004669 [[Pythium] brassicae (nom. inval.)]|nr:hypothetical protein PybrP1_004669 [[Pythium] brassicae (nom. inval.)]
MATRALDDIAALLRSAATKKRLEGVAALTSAIASAAPPSGDALAALLPDVLPCLRDNNAKVAALALAVLEAALARMPEGAVQMYFKVLWLNLVERLGDSKPQVRDKAVDVVVQLADVLDLATVFDRLLPCAGHKNWRTRESMLRCIWRCLESSDSLFDSMKDEALGHIIKLLEDSAKEVRDVAIETLERFYSRIGPPLLRELETRNIRSTQMKMLTDRFHGAQSAESSSSSRPLYASSALAGEMPSSLTSILSSYDLPVSSSSSMARYLESVRQRELSASLAAKAAADAAVAAASGAFSPSQSSTTSSRSDDRSATDAASSVSEREIQRDVASVYEQLHLDNDWSKRVNGLKSLQQLAQRCSHANDSTVLAQLSHAVKSVRERLCEQVADLRSSVSREACQTIQMLARVLRDDFNPHAESCLGALMKATYVTIQIISTSADACIRSVIESTKNGYVRFISKLLEGAKSRNQVLRLHCVSYLTLTLQQWSAGHLSKHLDLFLVLLPAILHDAIADVRAQSRKCFWAFHRVFPTEADNLLESLDASTQRNVRDDRSRANDADRERATFTDLSTGAAADAGARGGVRKLKSSRSLAYDASAPKDAGQSASSVQRVLQSSALDAQNGAKGAVGGVSGPRRVLGGSALSASDSFGDATDSGRGSGAPRVLSQGAVRVGYDARAKTSAFGSEDVVGSDRRKQTPVRPLRVLSSSDAALQPKSSMENLFASRPLEPPSSSAGFHLSAQAAPRPKRIQVAVEGTPPSLVSRADQENELKEAPKRVVGGVASLSPHAGVGFAPFPARVEASASKAAGSGLPAPAKAGSKPSTVASTAPVATADKLEDAVASLGSNSWSVRLDAADYIGEVLQRRVRERERAGSASSDARLDDRVVQAFVKHLSDAHYRVAQAVLKSFLALLRLATPPQLQPLLKSILAKLFQKQIETKESVRAMAKENLDFVAQTFDAAALTNVSLVLLMDGGNMKVKAAICQYLRALLPGADAYMRQSSHMRAFLGKMAQLLDEMPVSVTSACGELVLVAARLFGSEMEAALPMLPPAKRSVLTKLLKAKGVALNLSSSQSSATAERLASSTTSSRGSAAPETAPDNQAFEESAAPERSSRKRSESPNANSASPQRTIQKRKGADDSAYVPPSARLHLPPAAFPTGSSINSSNSGGRSASADASLASPAHALAATQSASFEEVLETLALNNATERERKVALQKVLTLTKAGAPDGLWDRCFGRLLFLLLDASAERDVAALKVLQGLVELQPRRAHEYLHPILLRLLESLGDKADVASHITESILSALVSSSRESTQVLDMLSPFVANSEPPVLQVALRLVKVELEVCERVAASDPRGSFLREEQWLEKILAPVARRLAHSSSDVRKSAVNCVVAFYFATSEDPELVWGYLSEQVDATKKKLVQIFVERARLERRQGGAVGATAASSS